MRWAWIAILIAGTCSIAAAQPPQDGSIEYRTPPEPIAGAILAPARPVVLLSPSRDRIALLERGSQPSVEEMSEPELRLAGLAINPRNNGPSRSAGYSGIHFRRLADGEPIKVALPEGARLINAQWSPDGRSLAFVLLRPETVELFVAESATGQARRVASGINAVFPSPYQWLDDGSALLTRLVPPSRGAAPAAPAAPTGPVVFDSGLSAGSGTTKAYLSNAHEAALFAYYATSQLALVPATGGSATMIGSAAIHVEAQPSPDGRYILVRQLKVPFSYTLPVSAFPQSVFVIDRQGRTVRTIADRRTALASLSGIPAGPRAIEWRPDVPSTLFWAERESERSGRDRLFSLQAPFTASARSIGELPMQFQHVYWARPDLAVATGRSVSGSAEERYAVDPTGRRQSRLLQSLPYRGGREAGHLLEATRGRLLLSKDASAALVELRDGIGSLDLATGQVARIWSERPGEELVAPLDNEAKVLVWREGPALPPNLYVASGRKARKITDFGDPAPAYAGIRTQPIHYRREDGAELNGTLYLPKDYDPARDGTLPLFIWAYPASVDESRNIGPGDVDRVRFVRPSGFDDLPVLLTGRGYAVFKADMPIFGNAANPANDSYVPQLVANAEAAVKSIVDLGIARSDRVAIGGHSYGAAMVATLLAHSDLFRAGIALSGAYNRTLTPFGFQASEKRNFWEAPDAYLAMSPFIHADRINEPLLLVHGTADSNRGTEPMQSERLFAALREMGKPARLVLLPDEDHNYRARESQLHVLWEIDRWLDQHLR